MRNLFLSAIAATVLLAGSAFAQTSSGNSSSSTNNSQTPANPTQVEQEIQQNLSKAGYTDIKVAPGSYLVVAKDSKGMPTEMVITPNSVTAVTAMNGSQSSSQGNNGSTTKK